MFWIDRDRSILGVASVQVQDRCACIDGLFGLTSDVLRPIRKRFGHGRRVNGARDCASDDNFSRLLRYSATDYGGVESWVRAHLALAS